MSGKRQPGSVVGNADVEAIDAGTSARIGMPAAAFAQMTTPAQANSTAPAPADVPMSGGIPYAVGGIAGIIGGIGGYYGGSVLGGEVYDWAENTFFTPLPEVAGP